MKKKDPPYFLEAKLITKPHHTIMKLTYKKVRVNTTIRLCIAPMTSSQMQAAYSKHVERS